jgi:hypothetical protein
MSREPVSKLRISLTALLLGWTTSCFAYTCSEQKTVSEAVESSNDLVFEGAVTEVEAIGMTSVSFRVHAVYKGKPASTVRVFFDTSYDVRKKDFQVGQMYLISANLQQLSITGPAPASVVLVEGMEYVSGVCNLQRQVKPKKCHD